jgi:hypothetical protein
MSVIANAARKGANVTTTTNGAKAFKSTTNANLDFFSKAGNIEYPNLVEAFKAALAEDVELALRNLLHMRDIRGDTGGYGVRDNSRVLYKWIATMRPELYKDTRLLQAIPVVGRWDDLFHLVQEGDDAVSKAIIKFLGTELMKEVPNGLLCKWLPKKGIVASRLRSYVKLTPKEYRQRLVKHRNVVETKMCAKQWHAIDYSKIPSKAGFIYRNAFRKQDETRYNAFMNKVVKGEVTINAGTLYPHEVLGPGLARGYSRIDPTKEGMWKNLKDFLPEGKSILPMIDVSGSMTCGSYGQYSCMDMSVALGIYLSERCKGPFQNLYMTFHERPSFGSLDPNKSLEANLQSVVRAPWGGNTNLNAGLELLLTLAIHKKAKQEDLPQYLIVLTDGQFDSMTTGKTNFNDAKAKYKAAGFDMPNIVFWNLNARVDNQPVKAHTSGSVLVSGYSPAILQSILSGEEIREPTPFEVMMTALTSDRYHIM